MKALKPKHVWQIDDDVYFVDETDIPGQLPGLRHGTVEEIHRNALRLRTGSGDYDLLWVDLNLCYSDADDLYNVLMAHIEKQHKKLKEQK